MFWHFKFLILCVVKLPVLDTNYVSLKVAYSSSSLRYCRVIINELTLPTICRKLSESCTGIKKQICKLQ